MRFKAILISLLFFSSATVFPQKSNCKKFKDLSGPEKCWVMWHPFIAKKAMKIAEETRKVTKEVMQDKLLNGTGNGNQIDAFRHTFWMANLVIDIGRRRARSLGKAHEKGNYKTYKQGKFEDGVVPDKISSEMDLFNNEIGIEIGEIVMPKYIMDEVLDFIKKGRCKIIKTDESGNFLDVEGNVIQEEELKGKWENEKCLVDSNQ